MLLSDAIWNRTVVLQVQTKTILLTCGYRSLSDIIAETAEQAGVEMPFVRAPPVYLDAKEAEQARAVLLQALQGERHPSVGIAGGN